MTVKILEVPSEADINQFRKDFPLSLRREVELKTNEVVSSENTHQILDVAEATRSSLLCSLTVKNKNAHLHWNFSSKGRSVFAEVGRITSSRVQSIMEVADAMSRKVPEDILNLLYMVDDPLLSLFVIRKQLKEGRNEAFLRLHEALEFLQSALKVRCSRHL